MADLTVSSDVDTMMSSANNAAIRSNIGTNDASNLTTGTIPAARVGADHIDAITEIASSLRSGADLTLVTGTAGTAGDIPIWNADGDIVDGPTPPSGAIVGTTDTQTLTNKTLTQPTITLKQGTAPTPTAEGDIQWDTDDDKIKIGDGTGTKTFSDDSSNASTYAAASHTHAASEIASGTLAHERGGLEADVSAYSGLIKISGGATSQAVAGTDYSTSSATETLTNKTFDANGTGNSISNIETADIASGSKSGADSTLMTGTAGTSGNLSQFNGDGDIVDSSIAASDVVTSENEVIIIALGDETTAMTTGTAKATFRMPFAMTLSEVRASVTTAPTGSVATFDINESGTTILSTKITIDATEKTSETAATAPVISDTSLADDAEITIDIDTVGSTVAGAGPKVYLIGTRT